MRRSGKGSGGPLLPLLALAMAVGLLTLSIASTFWEHDRQRAKQLDSLSSAAGDQERGIVNYFERARSLDLLIARNPSFRDFYRMPGSRMQKIRRGGRVMRETNQALAYLERLYPRSIGEACFIDVSGPENSRAVKGEVAPISELSTDETTAPFFGPTFALRAGQVHQTRPYVSPDTHEWVVAQATPVPMPAGLGRAIVHFEVTVDSFRADAAKSAGDYETAVIDARKGRIVFDSTFRQPVGDETRLGPPDGRRFGELAGASGGQGTLEVDGHLASWTRVATGPHNANEWIVVTASLTPAASWLDSIGIAQGAAMLCAVLLLGFALINLRSSQAELQHAALTDHLTGLANRRSLVEDLERRLQQASEAEPLTVAIFDLDGFKSYNDTFGHPAGDALLVRLAAKLRAAIEPHGSAYRMGGDEFCALITGPQGEVKRALTAARNALEEHGEGFSVTATGGSVVLPVEAQDSSEALRIADGRMYARKSASRVSAGRQSTDVLLRVLSERYPDIGDHVGEVAALSEQVGRRLGLSEEETAPIVQAAALHDIGKAAIPDAILTKPGPLDENEWQFIRQHPLIGERILAAAPALAPAERFVRWSHERLDGAGYPDGLEADQIPLGARIIAVCDAFDAMTSNRPYKPTPMSIETALAELRSSAGTQFDPEVVEAFASVIEAGTPASVKS